MKTKQRRRRKSSLSEARLRKLLVEKYLRRVSFKRPTVGEVDQLRQLLVAAGSVGDLIAWIDKAVRPKRRRGRPTTAKYRKIDGQLLQEANAIFEFAVEPISPSAAIELAIGNRQFGASKSATQKRLLAHLSNTKRWWDVQELAIAKALHAKSRSQK
jgi:hypothetical protein